MCSTRIGGWWQEGIRIMTTGKKALAGLLAVLVPGSALVVAFSPGINTPPAPPGTVTYVTKGTVTTTSTPSGVVPNMTQLALDFTGSGTVNHLNVTPSQHRTPGPPQPTSTEPALHTRLH